MLKYFYISLKNYSTGLASSEYTLPGKVLKTADTRMYADKNTFYKNNKRYPRTHG